MQHPDTTTTAEQKESRDPSQPILSGQDSGNRDQTTSSSAQPQRDGAHPEESKGLDRGEEDPSVPEPALTQPANAKSSSDQSNENQDRNSSGSGERKENAEGAERSRPAGSRMHNSLILNSQTQQTIMEIIQTLRNNATPDAAEQLFKTLTETSEEIEQSHRESKDDGQDVKAEDKEAEPEVEVQKTASVLSIEDQLKLLLDKLNSNNKLNRKSSQQAVHQQNGNPAAPTSGRRFQSGQTANAQGGPAAGSASLGSAQLITQAYHLINSVIMYPQIMWTRNFFYSLGAMAPQQQQIMHDWFIEMNEKQQIYIKEIERANDQLKETAASMFSEKGFSREQTDLFLKKVNFMENREYFFHKRRSMASRANAKDEDQEGSRDSSTGENQENARTREHLHPGPKHKAFQNQYPKAKKDEQQPRKERDDGKSFFDQLSSSCKLDDEQMKGILHRGPKDPSAQGPNERRFQNQDRGMRQADGGYRNERTSPFKRTNQHERRPYPRAGGAGPAHGEYPDGRTRGPRYPGNRGQAQYQNRY